jgi:hypothetical protein
MVKKSDNCWVKTDWLDAGEGAENPNWYRYENFDKAYEIALSEGYDTRMETI